MINEIRVNTKSTPSEADKVEQTIGSLPVTVKVNFATPELPADRAKVTTGAVRSPTKTDVEVDVVVEEVVLEEVVLEEVVLVLEEVVLVLDEVELEVVEVEVVEVEVEVEVVEVEVVVVLATVVVGVTVVDVVVVPVTTFTFFAVTTRHRNCFLTFKTQTTCLPATVSRAPSRTQTPPTFTET